MESEKAAAPERVFVHVRIRPFNPTELSNPDQSVSSILSFSPSPPGLIIKKDYESKGFHFDTVLNSDTTQVQAYQSTAKPVVQSVLCGYNASILAYGQTGTGKTHTMVGEEGENKGIIPRALEDVLDAVHTDPEFSYTINIGFVQVYMEMLQDLLFPDSPTPIRIREDPTEGVYLTGNTWKSVHSLSDCMSLLKLGDQNRNSAFTSMNAQSSRSHAVFMVKIEKRYQRSEDNERNSAVIASTLNLVDLAGSERVKKSKATGLRFDEAKNINLALLALGNCIQALADKKSKYVPYRDSKLTRLLANSLGGSSKTSLIVTIGPSISNVTETISTLNFGTRAMKIEINPSVSKLIDYKAAYTQLKAELEFTTQKYNNLLKTNAKLVEDNEKLKSEIEHLNIEKCKAETTANEYLQLLAGTKNSEKAEIELEKLNELQRICELQIRQKESEYSKLMSDFDQFIQESDEENSKLRKENADLKESNHNFREKLAILNEEREREKAFYEKITQEKAVFDALKLDNDSKEAMIQRLDKLRKTQDERIKKLINDIETLKKTGKNAQISGQKDEKIRELEMENEKLRLELRDTEIIVGEKREEIEQIRSEMARNDAKLMRRELERSKKEVEVLNEGKITLETRISELESMIKQLNSRNQDETEISIVRNRLLFPLQDTFEADYEALEGQLQGLLSQPSPLIESVAEFAEGLYTATHPEAVTQVMDLKRHICDLQDQLSTVGMREEAEREKKREIVVEMRDKEEREEGKVEVEIPSFMKDSSDEDDAERLLDEFSDALSGYLTEWLVLKTVLSNVQESFAEANLMVQHLQKEKITDNKEWVPTDLQSKGIGLRTEDVDWWAQGVTEDKLFEEYVTGTLEGILETESEAWGDAVAGELQSIPGMLGVSSIDTEPAEESDHWEHLPSLVHRILQSDPETHQSAVTSLVHTHIDSLLPCNSLPFHTTPLLPSNSPSIDQASLAFYYLLRWNKLTLKQL